MAPAAAEAAEIGLTPSWRTTEGVRDEFRKFLRREFYVPDEGPANLRHEELRKLANPSPENGPRARDHPDLPRARPLDPAK